MRERCEKNGGGQPRMIKQLLSSRKTTTALLDFIAATRVAQTAQKQNQETERKQGIRDEEWGLDEDRLERDGERNTEERREDSEIGGEG